MKPTRLCSMLVLACVTGCLSTPLSSESRKLPETTATDSNVKQAASSSPAAPAPAPAPAGSADPLGNGLGPKFNDFLLNQNIAGAPTKPTEAARMTVAWNNKIIFAPDPTHGGDPMPGLLVRVYLFGSNDRTLKIDGEFLAGVWDHAARSEGGRPQLIEVWHIDQANAKKFQRPDFMGDGYTLFLPWSKYHIDIKQITAQIRFNGADGRSLVASPEVLTIDHSETIARAAEKLAGRTVPKETPVPPTGTGK